MANLTFLIAWWLDLTTYLATENWFSLPKIIKLTVLIREITGYSVNFSQHANIIPTRSILSIENCVGATFQTVVFCKGWEWNIGFIEKWFRNTLASWINELYKEWHIFPWRRGDYSFGTGLCSEKLVESLSSRDIVKREPELNTYIKCAEQMEIDAFFKTVWVYLHKYYN